MANSGSGHVHVCIFVLFNPRKAADETATCKANAMTVLIRGTFSPARGTE